MKILIIDDNPTIRSAAKLVLSHEFKELVSVGDPRLLPALLRERDVDAVLLDMNFDPSRIDTHDGLFWLKKIKSMSEPPAVVVITAFGDMDLAIEAMKAGAEDFISKPWDNAKLIDTIKEAVERNKRFRATNRSASKAIEFEALEARRRASSLEDIKLAHIKDVIAANGGNISAAASHLGINRQTLYNMLAKTRIKLSSDKK